MPLFHILLLALVQGITEFLPISSSGHLILLHDVFDEQDARQTLLMDIAVHIGTLFAVLLYFRKDITLLLFGLCKIIRGDIQDENAKLGLHILLSSIPVIAAGFIMHHFDLFSGRNIEVIAWTTLIFGVLLWAADHYKPQTKALPDLTWKNALFIGLAQMLALIPGTSRSGITMTAARWLGFSRTEAARYSLLLAVIAISGAGTLGGISVLKMDNIAFTMDIVLAAFLAFIAGLIAITLMMKWLERASFAVFAIYRIALGLLLLGIVYGTGL